MTRGKIFFLLLIALSASFLNSCVKEEEQAAVSSSWSSLDPLSIPLKSRLALYNRGNMVKNPSFEQGKFFHIDSLKTNYNLPGWKKTSDQVFWVNLEQDSLYSQDEVYSGEKSIRIVRSQRSETIERGEGILSDFIKVIPGNYSFSYRIRLKNINPYLERRGARLFDAIDIRVLFYDKNMLLVKGESYLAEQDIRVDKSFKAQAFSNFWQIDSFGWAEVRGRSYYSPFHEGDIPDEAKYVKLFFGLKGTGTLWLDDVDFRYSDLNFTTLERISPMLDTSIAAIDLIIPTPKYAEQLSPVNYLQADGDSTLRPLILIPRNASLQTLQGARMIEKKLNRICSRSHADTLRQHETIVTHIGDQDLNSGRLIFSLGKNMLYGSVADHPSIMRIEDKDQAYTIFPSPDFDKIVILAGTRPIGDYYAAATVCQLLDDSAFVYHQARIIDYPDFLERSYRLESWDSAGDIACDLDHLKQLSAFKYNMVFTSPDPGKDKTDWYLPDAVYINGIRKTGLELRKMGTMSLGQEINPYFHLGRTMHSDSLDKKTASAWSHSSEKSFNQLLEIFNLGIQAGAVTIRLNTADRLPVSGSVVTGYDLFNRKDKSGYYNLQAAHIDLLCSLDSQIRAINKETSIEFIAPWYSNELIDYSRGSADVYFEELCASIPPDIQILWSGPDGTGLLVDRLDLFRFRTLTGKEPVFLIKEAFPRNCAALKGKMQTGNFFGAFQADLPVDLYLSSPGRTMANNTSASSAISRIRLLTIADYMWNTAGFDPDLSLWKALVSQYGVEQSEEILRLNQNYFRAYYLCTLIETQGQDARNIRLVKDILEEIDKHLLELDHSLHGDKREILKEIYLLTDPLGKWYTELSKRKSTGIYGRDSLGKSETDTMQ